MTEAASVRGEDVYIVGGANSAGQAAIHFAGFAGSRDDARPRAVALGQHVPLPDRAHRADAEHRGPLRDDGRGGDGRRPPGGAGSCATRATGECERVPARAMFVFIGAVPPTDWLRDAVLCDERGFVLTGPDVLAAGQPRLETGPRPLPPRNQRPRRLRRRRRPPRLRQARRHRRRRRRDGRDVGLAVPESDWSLNQRR